MIALNNKDMLGPTVPWVNPKLFEPSFSLELLQLIIIRN